MPSIDITKLLINKPTFKQGDNVIVYIDGLVFKGKIVGISSYNVIDLWIVQCDHVISDVYPFTTFTVPHTYITKVANE